MKRGAEEVLGTREVRGRSKGTKIIQGRSDINSENLNFGAGAIESIAVVNFMCHDHLKIEFGPRINFVIGANGSGKSAILTGLSICLGSKASFTQRGNSNKSFIKEGTNVATVTLVLSNRGSEAYRHDVYGDSIIIERKLVREGSGASYKIKSIDQKVISTKKDELLAICDHLKIQIDNPIIVLTQETAKKFIGNTSPEEKYQMFLKATYLSQLDDDLRLVEDTRESTERVINRKKTVIPELKQAYKAAELKFRSIKQAQTLDDKIQALTYQMAWSQVVEVEQQKAKAVAKTQLAKEKIIKATEKKNQESGDIEKANSELHQAKEKLVDFKEQESVLKSKINQIKQEILPVKQKIEEESRIANEITEDVKQIRNEIESYQKKIDEEAKKLDSNADLKKEIIKGKIQTIEEEITSIKSNIDELKVKGEAKDEEYNEESNQIRIEEEGINQLNNKIEPMKIQIQKYKAQKANNLTVFGNNIPQVLEDIKKEKRFQSPPIGPLGLYIKLKESRWAKTVESLLTGAFDGFLVTNHVDQKLLSNILSKRKCQNRIFISFLEAFDYSHGEPSSEYLTILRTLEFKDERIKRHLIVSSKIEKSILIERRAEADEIMYRPPKNVLNCYTIDGFQVGTKGGGHSTVAMNQINGPSKISENSDFIYNKLVESVKRDEAEIHQKRHLINQINDVTRKIDQEKRIIRDEIRTLNSKIRNLQNEKQDLEQELQEDEPANIAALEDAKKDSQRQMELLKSQQGAAVQSLAAIKAEYAEYQVQIKQASAELNEFKAILNIAQDEVDDKQKNVDTFHSRSQYYDEKLLEFNQSLEAAKEEELKCYRDLDTAIGYAQTICSERVEVTKSVKTLHIEINKTKQQLKNAQEAFGMTLEECQIELETKGQAFKRARLETAHLNKFVEDLGNALAARKERWLVFRQLISTRTRNIFHHQLRHRGFRGKLVLDHDSKKLIPQVHIGNDMGDEGSSDRNPRTLSGGEKSYSTICLLIALWEALDCPIRCLDEFDVFMDATNRKISADLIIKAIQSTPLVQCILITPLSINDVAQGNDIKICKLQDPKRDGSNQSTINFPVQN